MPKRGPGVGDELGGTPGTDETLVFEASDDVPAEEPGFDFQTFEQSEAAAAADADRQLVAAEEPTESPPEVRITVRRSALPPGEVVVDSRPVGKMTVVTMRGRISESFRGAELGRSLSGVVVFDLSEVDRASP